MTPGPHIQLLLLYLKLPQIPWHKTATSHAQRSVDGEFVQKPVKVAGFCILVSEKTESRNDVLAVVWCCLKDHLLVAGTRGWLWSASFFGAVDMSTCVQ